MTQSRLAGDSGAESPLGRRTGRGASLSAGGYLGSAVLAVLIFGFGVGVVIAVSVAQESPAFEAISQGVTFGSVAAMFATATGAVVGTPLTMLAHRCLRNVRRPGWHVLTFGVVGAVAATCLLAVLGLIEWAGGGWLLVLGAGSACAVGRWVVGSWRRGPHPR